MVQRRGGCGKEPGNVGVLGTAKSHQTSNTVADIVRVAAFLLHFPVPNLHGGKLSIFLLSRERVGYIYKTCLLAVPEPLVVVSVGDRDRWVGPRLGEVTSFCVDGVHGVALGTLDLQVAADLVLVLDRLVVSFAPRCVEQAEEEREAFQDGCFPESKVYGEEKELWFFYLEGTPRYYHRSFNSDITGGGLFRTYIIAGFSRYWRSFRVSSASALHLPSALDCDCR